MIGPSWLAYLLAALVLAIALFSAVRLVVWRVSRRQDEVDADGVHVLMGVAMAGMFVPRLVTFPAPLWEVIFAAGAVWFGWRAVQVRRARLASQPGQSGYLAPAPHYCRYPVPHLIDCVAMLYMFWAVGAVRSGGGVASAAMGAMTAGGARLPFLGLVLALLICGYVVWLGDRFPLLAAGHALPGGSWPGGAAAARVPAAGSAVVDGLAAGRAGTGSGDTAVLTGTAAAAGAGTATLSVAPRSFLAPRAAACCTIAMGVAMGIMLVDLL